MRESKVMSVIVNSKSIIMLDLDDTLCDLSSLLQESLYKRTGQDIPVCEWHDYNLGNIYGTHNNIVFECIKEDDLFLKAKPLSYVVEGVKELWHMGYDIAIVTARKPVDPNGCTTQSWLEKHGLNPDYLFITSHEEGKHTIAEALKPDYSLDDNLHYIHSCDEHVLCSVIKDMPWNRKNSGDFVRVNDFACFVDYVAGEDMARGRDLSMSMGR
jgi:5'(3')-deoxyribonucleotidase